MSGPTFVALDVETANQARGSICSIGLVVVEAGEVVDRRYWLTKPPADLSEFARFNIGLHGITPAAVADQPTFPERLDQLRKVVGDHPVVAHSAAFDIGALREACTAEGLDWPTLTYGCSVVMARRSLALLSYSLPFVCAELGVPLDQHHQADADAEAAARVVLALCERSQVSSLEDLAESLQVRLGTLLAREWSGCVRSPSSCGTAGKRLDPPPTANPDADPDHPLYGQVVVFTGALGMLRADAWDVVAQLGATPEKGVTKRTTLLVIGDGFRGDKVEDFHTGKALKAAKRLAKGHPIEVVTELDFYQLIADRRSSGSASDL
jgi:DNA polymerase-3 subunit epsilon